MEAKIIYILAFFVILIQGKDVKVARDQHVPNETTKPSQLSNLLYYNQPRNIGNKFTKDSTENLLRVKRQYRGRDRYPLPIIVGGVGYPAFGTSGFGPRRGGYGRGFRGRGAGARGFRGGGRGFGGRGIGGRGFGGRGLGGRGIGGRGGIGGGRGGRG